MHRTDRAVERTPARPSRALAVRLLVVCLLGCWPVAVARAQESLAPRVADSANLRFQWQGDAISPEGLELLQRAGEEYFAATCKMLGEAPASRITVLLEGPAQRSDGSRGVPHVDALGRVHLFQFGPTHHDYLGAFAHELVHAIRIGRLPHHDWFFEEGLAEFIALRLKSELRGFPWYGYPVTIVAGQWVESGAELSMTMLRERHARLNMPCRAQAYALRASFFDHLGRKHGDEAVLRMAREPKAGALEDYVKHVGSDFETLADQWRTALLAEYASIEDAAAQAARYRSETPIRYLPVCDSEGSVRR